LKQITFLRIFINQEMFRSKSWPQNLYHGLIFKQAGNIHQRTFCTKIWSVNACTVEWQDKCRNEICKRKTTRY